MTGLLALALDIANILGGLLLGIGLIRRTPKVGDDIDRGAGRLAPYAWIVAIVALVTGGYFLLVHLTAGPRVFHFELVGIVVGLLLIYGYRGAAGPADRGKAMLIAVFGIIAIIVGLQGIFTPDG